MASRPHIRLLTVGAATLALQTGSASAQATNATPMEEMVVTGIRGSLQQAIQTKREANAIVDALSAEDIGKFPDKNVAESLSKLPGITVDRNFGEGERVAIRGTDPALNRTLLNGQTVASTDWFIGDVPGRTFNYTLLAPEVVGRLEVYKSPEARIDEGSIGGTVILHTRKPLELDPLAFSATFEYGYNDRADDGSPNGSGLISWRNEAGTIGILVSPTYQDQDIERHGFESLGYVVSNFPGANGARMPNVINGALFTQDRERLGGTAAFQVRPTEQLEILATGFYVNGQYDNYNQSRYYFNGFGAVNGATRPAVEPVSGVTVRDGFVRSATIADNRGLVLLDAISRQSEVEVYVANLKAEWTADAWTLSAQAGRTRSTGGTQQQFFGEWE